MNTIMRNTHRSLPLPARLKKFRIINKEFELIAGLDGTLLKQAYGLRAQVFCKELQWVAASANQLEMDEFDHTTVTLGVVVKGVLVGCLRVHPYWESWMACTVFHSVTPSTDIQKSATCEVSRLAVDPRYRSQKFIGNRRVSDLIYQCLYAFCVVNGIHTSYMIVSKPTLKNLLDRGLDCQTLTPTERIGAHRDSPLLASLNWETTVGQVNNERYFAYRAVAKLAAQACH